MKKSDLIAGKHWVETKSGEIGCVMENGIVFKKGAHHINNYDENLINKYLGNDTIIKILISKSNDLVGTYDDKSDFDIVAIINSFKPITTLDELEAVRKKLCKKYNTSFYITNESGNYEIKFNGVVQQVGWVDNEHIRIDLPNHSKIIANTLNIKCDEPVYLDWEKDGGLTANPFRAVDLEKEGYELKLYEEEK